MTRRLTFLMALAALGFCGTARAGLLTSFASSYVKYQNCLSMSQPASKCYKLYCDPEQIFQGQITAFVDVPDPGAGQTRFSDVQELSDIDPRYDVAIANVQRNDSPGRQRLEVTVSFTAFNADVLPTGPVTLFALELGDLLDGLGNDNTFAGFYFKAADFVTTFDVVTNQLVTYGPAQLTGVTVRLPEPATGLLAAGLTISAWARSRRRSA